MYRLSYDFLKKGNLPLRGTDSAPARCLTLWARADGNGMAMVSGQRAEPGSGNRNQFCCTWSVRYQRRSAAKDDAGSSSRDQINKPNILVGPRKVSD